MEAFGGGRVTVTGIPSDITNWHHYVYVISQSGNIKKTFLDGVANSSGLYQQSLINKNRPFFIGGNFSNGTSSKIMWSGKIDDVRVYNRALTVNEIAALYTNTVECAPKPPTGSVGLYEQANDQGWEVYPSISSGVFYLALGTGVCTVEVLSPDGQLLKRFEATPEKNTIRLTDLADGIYLLRCVDGGRVSYQKVIKRE